MGSVRDNVFLPGYRQEILIKNASMAYYEALTEPMDCRFAGQGRKGDPKIWVADPATPNGSCQQQKISLKERLPKNHQWAEELA